MKKEKKLLKDMLIYICGNFGSKIVSILMLKFYTSNLSNAEYGTIDIVVTTTSLIMPLVSLQLYEAMFRMIVSEKREDKKQKYISTIFTILIINSVIFMVLGKTFVSLFNLKYQYYGYGIAMVIFGMIYESICQSIRGLNMNRLYAFLGIVFTLIFTSSNIIYISNLGQGIEGYLKSQILTYIITGILGVVFSKLYRYYKFGISRHELKEILNYSIPLIPNSICWWILNVSDRYFILYYDSAASVGIYSFASKITNLMYVLNTVFVLAWQSNSIEAYNDEDRDRYYTKIFYYYSFIQNAIVIGFSIVSYFLVSLLGANEYREAYKYIPILALAILFSTFATYYANSYIILKKTKEIMKTTIIAAVMNIILNFIFVPYFKIYGAIIATIISYMIIWLIRVCDNKIPIKIKFDKFNLSLNLSLTILACTLNIIEIQLEIKIITNIIIFLIFIINNIIYYFKIMRKGK